MTTFIDNHSIAIIAPFAFLQLSIIPGLILISRLRIKTNIFTFLSLIFAVSLVINYCLVLLLTSLGIFTQPILFTILLTECIYLLLIKKQVRKTVKKALLLTLFPIKSFFTRGTINTVLFILSILLIFFGIINILETPHIKSDFPDKVFTEWDVVLSWNRWALDWYQNKFPELTWEYPQLLPTNWSISYVLLGTDEIEFVAKSLMNIFPIIGIVSFIGLGLNFSSLELLFGTAFSSYFLSYNSSIGSGMVDIPVAIFSAILFSYYYGCCRLNQQYQPTFTQLLLLGIIAGGSGATKQTGVFLALVFLIILFINSHQRNKQFLLSHLSFIIPLMTIIGSWYLLKYIFVNDVSSNVVMLMSSNHLHSESFLPTRMLLAFKEYWSSPILILSTVFALIILPKPLNFLSQIVYIYIIPWTLIWSALFSYDARNSFPIYATLGLVAGCNIAFLLKLLISKIFRLRINSIFLDNIEVHDLKKFTAYLKNRKSLLIRYIKLLLISVFVVIIILVYSTYLDYPNGIYLQRQTEAKLHRGSYELNQKLLHYFNKNYNHEQFSKLIATEYQMLGHIPGLSERYVKYHISDNNTNNVIQKEKENSRFFKLLGNLIKRHDFQGTKRVFDRQILNEEAAFNNPNVAYLLYSRCSQQERKTEIQQQMELIFSVKDAYDTCFYKKRE